MQQIQDIGGTAYVVGGWVRDMIMGRGPHDKDYVVCGVNNEEFITIFPSAEKIGGSFPVFLMNIDGVKREVAFARKERKSGTGYRGFTVSFGAEVAIEDDLYRRDTTMNSMAWSPLTGEILDPYGGRKDIKDKIIRATSEHFLEDPVRALRAARQAAQFGFVIEPGTIEMMRRCVTELTNEPKERIIAEMDKALASQKPSKFFYALNDAGLLEVVFPWIYLLIGKTQPVEYHPDGDAFDHTMKVLDEVAEANGRVEVRFAALMHDIGKGETPEEILPHHYGHEKKGLEVLAKINMEMRIPRLWYTCAEFAIREHKRPAKMTHADKVVDLLVRLDKHPIGFDGFAAIMKADNNGEQADFLANYEKYMDVIHSVHELKIPDNLQGKQIGEWIRQKEIEAYKIAAQNSTPSPS